MTPNPSPYFPPRRTRWRARVANPLARLSQGIRLQGYYERIDMPVFQLVLSFLVPCHALAWTRFARLRTPCRCVYATLLGAVVVFLGHWMADAAFGLMIGLHASGFLALRRRLAIPQGFIASCLSTLAVLIALGLWIYDPVSAVLRDHFWMPLRTEGGVVVVNRASRAGGVRRGDLVAYRIHERNSSTGRGTIHVQEGFGFERVWGEPGDRIVFGPGFVEINGQLRDAAPSMPVEGEWVVPQGRWFIWPSVSRQGGHQTPEAITAALMALSVVSQDDFVGRPFRRWFGRRQPIPSS